MASRLALKSFTASTVKLNKIVAYPLPLPCGYTMLVPMRGVLSLLIGLAGMALPLHAADGVVLLHGIARSPASLATMEKALKAAGYETLNLAYPSRSESIESIAATIDPSVTAFAGSLSGKVHFVTHSMGGLVARGYIHHRRPENLGNLVMLGPPNQGSDVADFVVENPAYRRYFGPAGQQLSTTTTPSVTAAFGVPDYPIGIIAGDRSVNLIMSWLLIPGPDDGKVSVSQTAIAGAPSPLVLHTSHPFIMSNPEAISATIRFLKEGHLGSLR